MQHIWHNETNIHQEAEYIYIGIYECVLCLFAYMPSEYILATIIAIK